MQGVQRGQRDLGEQLLLESLAQQGAACCKLPSHIVSKASATLLKMEFAASAAVQAAQRKPCLPARQVLLIHPGPVRMRQLHAGQACSSVDSAIAANATAPSKRDVA